MLWEGDFSVIGLIYISGGRISLLVELFDSWAKLVTVEFEVVKVGPNFIAQRSNLFARADFEH